MLDADYVEEDFRDTWVSIEAPVEREHFPGVWVDWEPTGALQTAGIDHKEWLTDDDGTHLLRRWRFQGFATYTAVALTSLEHGRLTDEMIRIMAFGDAHPTTSPFRSYIESNPYLAMNMDFDEIEQRGFTSAPGTPWGSPEVVYEATLAMECVGEFVSSVETGALVILDAIHQIGYTASEGDPTTGDDWQ